MFASMSDNRVYYQAGFSIGSRLVINNLEELPDKIGALGLGSLKLQSVKSDRITVNWYECLTCSHLDPIGRPQCYLEAGTLAGVLNKFFKIKKRVEVEETKCWGTGDKYCQMEATIYPASEYAQRDYFLSQKESDKLLVELAFQAVQATKNYYKAIAGLKNEMGGFPLSNWESGFQLVPFGLIIADDQGRVVKINKDSIQILGITNQRVQGRFLEEIMPLSNYSQILELGKPKAWKFQETEGKTFIVIGMPLEAQIKTYMLFQLFPAESQMAYLIMDNFKKPWEEIEQKNEMLPHNHSGVFRFHQMLTSNIEFKNLLCLAQKAAQTDATILITGESGTGKGVLAQAVHQESSRRHRPFVKVNCAAIPPELLESELFGYEEGAFTGAKKGGKPGKFELADGGTIFLDEIGDMPPNMQAKLLTVLQEKEIERLGSTQTRKIDVRVIAATNKDLEKMVQEGRFREDLYYRLNVVKLTLPPLRERPEDISLLAENILERLKEDYNKKLQITPAAMECLLSYSWPGNVRELENVLERAAISAEDDKINPQHLMINNSNVKEISGKVSYLYKIQMEAEKEAILHALEAFGGEKTRAAKALGISRQALYSKMVRYGLLKK